MNLLQLQQEMIAGKVRLDVAGHARIEAMKDGIMPEDLEHAAHHGKLIEEYPERSRGLLLDSCPSSALPCHVVLEYFAGDDMVTIVTAYIPDLTEWHPDFKTRK